MPPRKSPDESEKPASGPQAESVPIVDREDAAALTRDAVAPAPAPLGDDQEEVTLADGTTGVVDKAFAEALRAAQAKQQQAKTGEKG